MSTFVDNPVLRDHWWAVCRVQDLDVHPIAARPLGFGVVVWRGPDGAVAALDRCPHREAPLSMGSIDEGGCLTCPYHGWVFDGAGQCIDVPSQRPEVPIPPRAALTTLPVIEQYGLVWVCVGRPSHPLPAIPEASDPAFRIIATPFETWNASAARICDNFLDSSHFAFLHSPTFGGATDPLQPPVEVTSDEHSVAYRVELTAANPEWARTTTRQTAPTLQRTMLMSVVLPFTTINRIVYDSGLVHVVLNALTPIDDVTTMVCMTLMRNDDHSVPPDEAVALDYAIVAEDREMLERIEGPFPLDVRELQHVAADKASVEWMRKLRQLLMLDAST
jgi:phenylpropionate dioxygenase-like ring-hydroxylating dioxygenase large terminal subunit